MILFQKSRQQVNHKCWYQPSNGTQGDVLQRTESPYLAAIITHILTKINDIQLSLDTSPDKEVVGLLLC